MSKIVFFCIPEHGHTNQTLGVVREFISRGHQVFYYPHNLMRGKNINVKSIRATIENVLNTKSYYEQALKISQGFRKCTGAKGIADKIEKMCK